jgi:cell division protein FtsW
MIKTKQVDKTLLFSIIALVVFGLVIFFSASLGLLARSGARFGSIVSGQIGMGLILGSIGCYFISRINYKVWGKYAFWILLISIIVTACVFIPGIGFEHGGAKRWIAIGSLTFQPAEFLKFAYILYLSAWIATVKTNVSTIKSGFVPFLIISGIVSAVLLLQPDTDTTMIMVLAGLAIYFTSGANWKHILTFIVISFLVLLGLLMTRPYLMQRVTTFINPSQNAQSSGYQIQQSLIAVGSGGFTGKGFGQSVQKFNYLPEPIGDSIFAVASEEFGFIGASILVLLFALFATRSLYISFKIKDTFGGLLMLGIAIIIVAQSFLNMASMLGIFPLSGLPLIFVSHGGTALFFSLCACGVMLNISRYKNI